jgi:hypothetical protein
VPLLTLTAVLLLAVVGCANKKKVTIHGTISYKRQPLHSGILSFSGPEGAYTTAAIQPDGTFIITDVVPGEVKVGVMEAPKGSQESGTDKPPVALPEKYHSPDTSELKYTITSSTKELPIEIK